MTADEMLYEYLKVKFDEANSTAEELRYIADIDDKYYENVLTFNSSSETVSFEEGVKCTAKGLLALKAKIKELGWLDG